MKNKFITTQKFRKERIITILNGLFNIYRYKNLYWDFKIFNYKIFSWAKLKYEGTQEISFHLFPHKDYKMYIRNLIFDNIITSINNKNIKNIIYIRSGIGDAYNFSLLLDRWMQKYNLDYNNTSFLGHREILGHVLFMHHNKLKYKKYDIPGDISLFSIEKGYYNYKNKNFYFILPKHFVYQMFEDMKNGIQRKYIYDELCDLYNIKSYKRENNIPVNLPINTDQKALIKLSQYNIEKNNFVYLIPEAYSSVPMSETFWKQLEIAFEQKGYNVVYNSKKFDIFEAYYLASISKGIIGMTSGFLEVMLQTKTPVHCIFTSLLLHNVSAKENARVYSKKHFPNVNSKKIYEYIAPEYSEDELCKTILDNFIKTERGEL